MRKKQRGLLTSLMLPKIMVSAIPKMPPTRGQQSRANQATF
jgi:hypothetical protein